MGKDKICFTGLVRVFVDYTHILNKVNIDYCIDIYLIRETERGRLVFLR